jgi:predicted flap endonuclease-1-like 5' DNA nuclease
MAAIGAGGLALILALLLLAYRRSARRLRRSTVDLREGLDAVTTAASQHAAGEREARWALTETGSALTRQRGLSLDLQAQNALVLAEIDDLAQRLVAADADLIASRRDADESQTEVARLESELAVLTLMMDSATTHAKEGVAAELGDLHRALAETHAHLEAERAELERLRIDLAATHSPAAEIDTQGGGSAVDRLISSEARRRDLEDRLAALSAIRSSEQRRAEDQIAGLERLHLQIGERERRIEELEAEIKEIAELRDDAVTEATRLQVELVRLRSALMTAQQRMEVLEQHSAALAQARERIAELERELPDRVTTSDELDRLRKSLEAERSRAEGIARRATEAATTDASYAHWDHVVRERVDRAVERETVRLSDQVEQLRAVVAEKEARLRLLIAASTDDTPRDTRPVTLIKGIGPVIAAILSDHGVTSLSDIAAFTDDDIDRLGPLMPVYPGRIRDDDWIGQAQSLL